MQLHAPVAHRNRLNPVALVGGQVRFAQRATGAAGVVGHGFGQIAGVKSVALGGGNACQRVGLAGADEVFTRQRRAALGRKRCAKAGLGQHVCHLRLPLAVYGGRHQKALARITQRGLEQLGKRHAAKAV